jgi:hypothetical protein
MIWFSRATICVVDPFNCLLNRAYNGLVAKPVVCDFNDTVAVGTRLCFIALKSQAADLPAVLRPLPQPCHHFDPEVLMHTGSDQTKRGGHPNKLRGLRLVRDWRKTFCDDFAHTSAKVSDPLTNLNLNNHAKK